MRRRASLVILASLVLGGCSGLDVVRSDARQSRTLAADVTPILDGMLQSCREQKARIRLYTGTRKYDPQDISDYVNSQCGPIAESNGYAAQLAYALTDYADFLEQILGDAPVAAPVGSADGLRTALTRLRDANGMPIVGEAQIPEAVSLASFDARQVASPLNAGQIRQALDHHEAVEIVGQALITYMDSNFMAYVGNERRDLETALSAVEAREDREPLAARRIEEDLWKMQTQLDAKTQLAARFDAAVKKMIEAHADLLNHVNDVYYPQRLDALFAFTRAVRSVDEELRLAF